MALVLVVCAGYFSDGLSMKACESDTARAVWNNELQSGAFFVADSESDVIFARSGIWPDPANAFGPPWQSARIGRATTARPFIVEVQYATRVKRFESGGARTYVCILGWRMLIRESRWPGVQSEI